ncbi:MAG: class I SAM-dependent methyltransferase [Proteobacteria bacterium]|nr:class I SAM-dependent methyltransferase [Pseudomonadota bacterium]
MEAAAYEALAKSEEKAWYYQARLQVVEKLLQKYAPKLQRALKILDVGSGTGGSTVAFSQYGNVMGIEPSALARRLSKERFPGLEVQPWSIEDLAQQSRENFDVAVILCVLYHQNIKDPGQALAQLAKVQNAGSILIWNEPAYDFLWRQHDRQTASGRRFHPQTMHRLLKEHGYDLLFQSHLLAWAFPIAWLLARWDRLVWGSDRQSTSAVEGLDHKPLPQVLNRLLYWLSLAEWRLNLWGMGLPFGVSHLLVARRLPHE